MRPILVQGIMRVIMRKKCELVPEVGFYCHRSWHGLDMNEDITAMNRTVICYSIVQSGNPLLRLHYWIINDLMRPSLSEGIMCVMMRKA